MTGHFQDAHDDEKPIREGVQGSDDHEGGLSAEEDADDDDQHQSRALCVALPHLSHNYSSICQYYSVQ